MFRYSDVASSRCRSGYAKKNFSRQLSNKEELALTISKLALSLYNKLGVYGYLCLFLTIDAAEIQYFFSIHYIFL